MKTVVANLPTRAILSLGSNIEPREEYLAKAREKIAQFPQTRIYAVSSVIETEPVDVRPEDQDRLFLNQVIVVMTSLDVDFFFDLLCAVEVALGRKRTGYHSPRTIDLDLIDFGGLIRTDENLILPHPRAKERAFVMEPLKELGIEFK